MQSGKGEKETKFQVVVTAIMGGPFELRKGQVLTKRELGIWKESLLRHCAIVQIESEEEWEVTSQNRIMSSESDALNEPRTLKDSAKR
ncbi:MAG: hypothetical protein BGO01_02035 [Armatimonadetes bacterium 55-13]|nr:MAG: hypothetical protein BGO01_02035 [Armatimonadetes bacterium 55-13]